MILEYFKTTFRSLNKNKMISSINIFGLAISLAAFIFISRYVTKELNYDKGHAEHERIFRVAEIIESENYLENSSSSPIATGPLIIAEFSDAVETQVRLFDFQSPIVTITLENQEQFNERWTYFTDPDFFNIFDFSIIEGDAETVLTKPHSAAISKDLAEKYFGNESPIGKKVTREGFQTDFEITAVYESNSVSHIRPTMLYSWQTIETVAPNIDQNRVWNPAWTYIKLKPSATVADLEKNKFPILIQKHYDDRTKDKTTHYLQPISDIHLQSHLEFEMAPNSDMKYVYIFISCAFFLILIAVVNFINLSTSFSLLRSKEIGVRKVSGATKSQLVIQFLSESVIISLISFVIALGICYLSISLIRDLINLELSEIFTPGNILIQLAIVMFIGLVSGIYPAFFISSFNPLMVFRGKFISNKKGQLLRKGLVISQFTIAIVLIIFTYVTYKQLNYLYTKDYGYNSSDVIILDATNTQLQQRLDAFKGALKADAGVQAITVMSDILGVNNNNHDFHVEGTQPGTWNFYPALMIDEDVVDAMGLEVVAGRNYDRKYQKEDSLSILINQSMAKTLGFASPEEALGKQLNSIGGGERIIGVVKDFNYKSFHSAIGPFALDIPRRNQNGFFFFRHVAVRVSNVNNGTLSHIEQVWKDFVPNKPFTYKVLDNELKALYKSENNLGQILSIFAILTVIIACMGLFALATFIAQQKTKEIGIRKVLGASFLKLFFVGYKEQFYLIVGAFVIAIPIAYLFIDNWLEDFAYRVNVGVVPFLSAGFMAILISAATVFSNVYKTIIADPAEVLRDE